METQTNTPVIESTVKGSVAFVFFNRPDSLNALSEELITALAERFGLLDQNDAVGAIVLAGKGRAFAAGADIKAMADATEASMTQGDRLAKWLKVWSVKKPVIAAVHGFALGGGCELAMGCDMIVAAEDAEFGQPEVLIGVMPGAGGTQRLTRAIGKARAMEMVLTGRRMNAWEAYEAGLVTRIVPKEILLAEAEALALEIAQKPRVAVRRAKEGVSKSQELPLQEGLTQERKLFYSLFSTEDQKEGMKAFLEKRAPQFKGK